MGVCVCVRERERERERKREREISFVGTCERRGEACMCAYIYICVHLFLFCM